MKLRMLLVPLALLPLTLAAQNIYDNAIDAGKAVRVHVNTSSEPLHEGKYKPT